MTTPLVPGSAVIGRGKSKWKQLLLLPEIPATRFSCVTSGSLRPKLGLCILSVVLVIGVCLLVVPLVSDNAPPPKMSSEKKSDDAASAEKATAAALTHKESVAAVAQANQAFTGKILPAMIKEKGEDQNLVASPFSLSSVLAMLYAGAGGATADQIRTTLSLPDKDDVLNEGYGDVMRVLQSNDNFTLEAANRLYAQSGYNILQAFLDRTLQYFKAEAQSLDFSKSEEARGIINQWVEKQTREKIKDLIPSGAIDGLTRLVLVNAVYFKGTWEQQFDKKATVEADFHVSDAETVKVSMMHRSADFAGEANKELGCHVLQIPYKGERLSMLLFLSDEAAGFAEMEKKFASFDVAGLEIRRKIKYDVSLPKFKLETSHTLNQPLQAIGITNMFQSGTADFSKLTEKAHDLYVSAVLQKAFIEVNEEGTEAAAATGGIMMMRMAVRTQQFHCNRPFLFAIKDNLTGLVIFTGRVMNPQKN